MDQGTAISVYIPHQGKEKSLSCFLTVSLHYENHLASLIAEKFCNHVTVHRASDRPSAPQAYQCKMTRSTGMAIQMQLKVLFGRKSHGRSDFRKKKQQQSRVFFCVIFLENRERARASY